MSDVLASLLARIRNKTAAVIAESRVLLVPQALVFIPAALFAARGDKA